MLISLTVYIQAPEHALDQEILAIDIDDQETLAKLKEEVNSRTGIPAQQQFFYFNGQSLNNDAQTLAGARIGAQESQGSGPTMLAMLVRPPGAATQSQARRGDRSSAAGSRRPPEAGAQEIENVRLQVVADPRALAQLRQSTPALADAASDPDRFRQVFMDMKLQENERERERARQIQILNEDPFNVEAQRKIEEMIRQDRVTENLQYAYENNPEAFGRVTMLYVNAEVNGHAIKAFVDSGAQVTIMSPSCAEACGIMRLIDTRYQGMARGVGTAKILGRVHHAEIKIGGAVMPCAFTVMEGKDVDLLFGLDMLKRYQASIDLAKNALCFSGIEVPFLGESDIPKQAEEAALDEPTIPGPNGTEIGAKSGAVRPAGTSAAASGSSKVAVGNPGGNFQGQGQSLGGSSSAAAPTPPTPSATSFPKEHIDQLMNLGFSREDAVQALSATDGNMEYAAGLLFSKQ